MTSVRYFLIDMNDDTRVSFDFESSAHEMQSNSPSSRWNTFKKYMLYLLYLWLRRNKTLIFKE